MNFLKYLWQNSNWAERLLFIPAAFVILIILTGFVVALFSTPKPILLILFVLAGIVGLFYIASVYENFKR